MTDQSVVKHQAHSLAREIKTNATILIKLTSLLWILELLDWLVFGGSLDQFGVRPRSLSGLWGILFAPFLHGGFVHLLANSVPLILLGGLTMSRKRTDFFVVSVVGALVAGLGTWLIGGAHTVHIGASSLIFAYLGFLLTRGVFDRSLATILFSGTIGLLFGGMVVGVLPLIQPGISWEGHLFGFIGGILVARTLGKELEARRSSTLGKSTR